MNVLLLNHAAVIGGASRSLTTVVGELRLAGCQVTILTPPGPMCTEWERMGARISLWYPPACYWLGASTYSSGLLRLSPGYLLALVLLPFRLLKGARLIRKLVKQEMITTVYVNSLVLFPLGLILRALCRGRGIRVIWHVRELINPQLPSPVYSLLVRSITRSSDLILAITTNEAAPFEDGGRVQVIHNTVADTWLSPASQVPSDGERSLRVCMTSGFLAGKGIPDFLRMARLVAERFPDVEFELYTTRPALTGRVDALVWRCARNLSGLARLVAASLWNVSECVLDGRIRLIFGQNMTPEKYGRCSIYVRADETGCPWGRDIIEAMCVGLPVVATGSSQEFVLDGQTGFLVQPRAPELLAEAVERLLRDAELRRLMGEAGRKRAAELFSPEVYRSKILAAFAVTAPSKDG